MSVKRGMAVIGYLCFMLYTGTLLYTSVSEFQSDIYNALPTWAWIAFSTGLLLGTVLLYEGIRNRNQAHQIHGLLIIVLPLGVFWFYAELLGMRFWSASAADLLMHFGQAKGIVNTGVVADRNLYPPGHILLAELAILAELPVNQFGPLLSLIYYSLLILGLVLVTRRYANTRIAMFVGVAGIPIFYWKYAHHFMPWFAYFALIPYLLLLLSVYQAETRRFQRSFIGLGILWLTFGIGLGHPMSGLVTAIVVVTIPVADKLGAKWLKKDQAGRSLEIWLLLPLLVAFPIWYLNQWDFQRFLSQAIVSIIAPTPTPAGTQVNRASASGYTAWQLVTEYLIDLWGTSLLILSVGLVIASVILYRVWHRRASINEFTLVSVFAVGGTVAVVALVANLVVNPEPYRPNQITIAASIVLLGTALWWATDRAKGHRGVILRGALLAVVMIGVIWTPYTIYYEGQHVAEHEFEGAEHHLEYYSTEVPTWSDRMSRRLSQNLLGMHDIPRWENRVFGRDDKELPKYLGYNDSNSVREWISDDEFYLITKERDTEWYKTEPRNRYAHIRYYTDENVSQLHRDTAVAKTYSNGGFTVWWGNTSI